MRLKHNKTSKGKCFYIIRSVYKNGRNTSETYERLGYPDEIKEKHHCDDPEKWMVEYLEELNELEKAEKNPKILVPYHPSALIPKGVAQSYNVGYLFLQKVYYELRLDLIAAHMTRLHSFHYDMNAVLSRLVYGRILYPSSKISTFRQSSGLLEPPGFEYQHVERALSVIASGFDWIQAELYQYSRPVVPGKPVSSIMAARISILKQSRRMTSPMMRRTKKGYRPGNMGKANSTSPPRWSRWAFSWITPAYRWPSAWEGETKMSRRRWSPWRKKSSRISNLRNL